MQKSIYNKLLVTITQKRLFQQFLKEIKIIFCIYIGSNINFTSSFMQNVGSENRNRPNFLMFSFVRNVKYFFSEQIASSFLCIKKEFLFVSTTKGKTLKKLQHYHLLHSKDVYFCKNSYTSAKSYKLLFK